MELRAAEVKQKPRKLPFQCPFLRGPRVGVLPTEGTLLLVDGSVGERFHLGLVPSLGLPGYHSGMALKIRVRGQPESFSMSRGSHGKALTPDPAQRAGPAAGGSRQRPLLEGRRAGARSPFVTQPPPL